MSAAQKILEALAPHGTPALEEMHAEMQRRRTIAEAAGGTLDEDERLVAAMILETLEMRDPEHVEVRAAIARYESEMAAWA